MFLNMNTNVKQKQGNCTKRKYIN